MSRETSSAGRPAGFSRDAAVKRAADLFWKEGYLAVTTRDLAAAMQIQRSSFYNSFGDKEAVFAEALEQYSRETPDALLESIGPGEPVIPAIVSVLRELCRVRAADADARGCLVCNSVAELVGVDERLGPILEAAIEHRIALMKRLFRQASEQREFEAEEDAAAAARAFVTFLLGLNVASKAIRAENDLWAICRTFLRGIGVDESALQ